MSILFVSKVYERCMQEQITNYFVNLLSDFQCELQQGFSAQCLLDLIEKRGKIRDLKGFHSSIRFIESIQLHPSRFTYS